MPKIHKAVRLAAIEALPDQMQDSALLDWPTVAALLNKKDIEHTRELITAAGVPLVHVSDRRKLPTWGAIREFIRTRQRAPTDATI
jgi:hypothetical protein